MGPAAVAARAEQHKQQGRRPAGVPARFDTACKASQGIPRRASSRLTLLGVPVAATATATATATAAPAATAAEAAAAALEGALAACRGSVSGGASSDLNTGHS